VLRQGGQEDLSAGRAVQALSALPRSARIGILAAIVAASDAQRSVEVLELSPLYVKTTLTGCRKP